MILKVRKVSAASRPVTGWLLLVLFMLCCGKCPAVRPPAVYAEIPAEELLGGGRFSFFDEPLTLRFTLVPDPYAHEFTGVVLRAQSSGVREDRIILDWRRGGGQSLLLTSGDKVQRLDIEGDIFSHGPVEFIVGINFKRSLTTIQVADTTFTTGVLGFNINDGYKFFLLPGAPADSRGRAVIEASGFSASTPRLTAGKTQTWHWLVAVIVVDLLFFWGVHIARSRRRRRLAREHYAAMSAANSAAATPAEVELPHRGAIYLLGGFHVYDRAGEDITRKFSPLVRELLALLILYSSGKGISSEKMRELLWYDKDEAAARNNRAVNLGKLRALLDTVGDYEISNQTGYWRITFHSLFVDYLQWRAAVGRGENVNTVIALVGGGGLLPEEDHPWLDDFKSDFADKTIDLLLGQASASQDQTATARMADAVFTLDPVNEQALYLRCRAYMAAGKHNAAKGLYDRFAKQYESLYGEPYSGSIRELTEH